MAINVINQGTQLPTGSAVAGTGNAGSAEYLEADNGSVSSVSAAGTARITLPNGNIYPDDPAAIITIIQLAPDGRPLMSSVTWSQEYYGIGVQPPGEAVLNHGYRYTFQETLSGDYILKKIEGPNNLLIEA